MGDFAFWDLKRVNALAAVVWFWSFMILIFLIFLNLLLAIVMDTLPSFIAAMLPCRFLEQLNKSENALQVNAERSKPTPNNAERSKTIPH